MLLFFTAMVFFLTRFYTVVTIFIEIDQSLNLPLRFYFLFYKLTLYKIRYLFIKNIVIFFQIGDIVYLIANRFKNTVVQIVSTIVVVV